MIAGIIPQNLARDSVLISTALTLRERGSFHRPRRKGFDSEACSPEGPGDNDCQTSPRFHGVRTSASERERPQFTPPTGRTRSSTARDPLVLLLDGAEIMSIIIIGYKCEGIPGCVNLNVTS